MTSTVRRLASVATALVLMLVATAAAASPGDYTGTTSQTLRGHALSFGVEVLAATRHHPEAVHELQYTADYTGTNAVCAKHFDGSTTRVFPSIPVSHSSFSAAKTKVGGSSLDIVHNLQGQFSGKRLTGSFTESFSAYDPNIKKTVHCTTGKVQFAARKA
jgi:hypothetical protein